VRTTKVQIVVLSSVACAAASCSLLPTFEIVTTGTGGGGGSGPSAASVSSGEPSASVSTGSVGAGDPCGLTFPSLPSNANDGGDLTFTTALHRLNLGETSAVGLDLDLTCSCHGKGASCIEPTMHCDDPQGRDNSVSGLFATIMLALGPATFSSSSLSMSAAKGSWSILYRVQGYNGMPNDAKVELDWYLSTGFDTTTASSPQWNGSDVWKIMASSVNAENRDKPRYLDTHAYVNDNMLVASIPETLIPLPIGGSGSLSFTLTGAGLLARIAYDQEAKTYRLVDGQVVGRLKLTDIFKTMSAYRDATGMPLCTDGLIYPIAKTNFCESADILAAPGTPSLPCDAVSFAVGFTADPAVLGAVDTTPPPTTPGCPPATDPANDKCSTRQ
jgi:hypothetical protein